MLISFPASLRPAPSRRPSSRRPRSSSRPRPARSPCTATLRPRSSCSLVRCTAQISLLTLRRDASSCQTASSLPSGLGVDTLQIYGRQHQPELPFITFVFCSEHPLYIFRSIMIAFPCSGLLRTGAWPHRVVPR